MDKLSDEVRNSLNTSQVDIPPIGLEHLKMSDQEKANMSFNESDQKFFEQFMFQISDNIKKEQANSIAAQNVLIFSKFEMINEGVAVFKKNKQAIEKIGQFDHRLSREEKRTDRLTLAVLILAIILLLVVLFGPWYHNQFLSILKEHNLSTEWVDNVWEDMRTNNVSETVRGIKQARTDDEITAEQNSIQMSLKPIPGMTLNNQIVDEIRKKAMK